MTARSPEPMSSILPPLQRIPGEIKNRMYRLCLLEQAAIIVRRSCFKEPGLLQVNREIRDEAAPIYYAENRWEIQVPGFDSTVLLRWCTKHGALQKAYASISFPQNTWSYDMSVYRGDWAQLLEWLEHCHANRVPGMDHHRNDSLLHALPWDSYEVEMRVVATLFKTVWLLRARPWAEVKRIVKLHRWNLEALNTQ